MVFHKLDGAKLLSLADQKIAAVDLHPSDASNAAMGHLFEELICKFGELSNETAGKHFTPREVIRLMVNLLLTTAAASPRERSVLSTIPPPAPAASSPWAKSLWSR